ncbi:MAG TPA: RsiV family protein [Pyrinomonadaceae bacterium]|jgi:hypothetical protein
MNTRTRATLFFFPLLLLLLTPARTGAQEAGGRKVFRGSVGDYPVSMSLRRGAGGEVSGTYSYEGRGGGELALKGSVNAKGEFTLEEFDGAKKTGTFKGEWQERDYEPEASLSGNWTKPGGGGEQWFYLVEQPAPGAAAAVTTKRVREGGKRLGYSVNAEYPQVAGAEKFNRLVEGFVTKEIADFKKGAGPEPGEKDYMPEASEDSLNIRYTFRLLTDGLVSVEFPIDYYEHGAAHGSHAFRVVNYDLKSGRELSLADLFRPGSAYLNKMSEVAVRQLRRWNKDSADYQGGGGEPYLLDEGIADGAAAKAENYQNWTITPRGLAVTFDYYQLGAYAAGAPSVVLPYADLKEVLRPGGPLEPLSK